MSTSSAQNTIHWKAILSLIFLDLAILISWMAYHEYQPALLQLFKFTEFTVPLAILQGVILFVTPPIAGLVADRMIKKGGNRLPVVSIGINFVSMVFMVVAITVFAEPGGIIRLLFPLMVALWLIAMNIFHSPAISTVELFVPESKMPIVVALFVILADMVASLEPILLDLIHFFGGPLTFAVGGALVFTSGWLFTRVTKTMVVNQDASAAATTSTKKTNFPVVFLLGLLVGAATTFFFKLFPALVDQKSLMVTFVPDLATTATQIWNPENGNTFGVHYASVLTSILIAVAAVLSFPMGILAEKVGTKLLAGIGAALAAVLVLAFYLTTGATALVFAIAFPVAFAACTVTFLPIAFQNLEKQHIVFGIGIFFSGVELLSSVVDVLQVL
jgi:MFS family permease